MNADRLQRNIFRVFLAALVAAGLLFASIPMRAADCGGGDYIVKYKESAARLLEDGNFPFDVMSRSEALRLDRAGLLEWYEPDVVGYLLEDPAEQTVSDYYESYQWNLDLIGAEEAFQRGCLGQGVRIGVVDSGISPHPALSERLLPGHNYAEGARDETDTSDQYGHGTAVAGLIAGAGEHGYRYAQTKGKSFTGLWFFLLDYDDAGQASDWAYEAMCYLTMQVVIQGTGERVLSPKSGATRAQVATMLMRFEALEQ